MTNSSPGAWPIPSKLNFGLAHSLLLLLDRSRLPAVKSLSPVDATAVGRFILCHSIYDQRRPARKKSRKKGAE